MADDRDLCAEERIARAKIPGKKAPALHAFYRGKVETTLKCAVTSFDDFGIWYTPGVATPCCEIHADPSKVFEYTNKANTIAVVSDGSRVLGLGNIGPLAGLAELTILDLAGCEVSDISAMENLANLNEIVLDLNQVTDLAPLVDNTNFGEGDRLYIRDNPLSQEAVCDQIPALEARGVEVDHNATCLKHSKGD